MRGREREGGHRNRSRPSNRQLQNDNGFRNRLPRVDGFKVIRIQHSVNKLPSPAYGIWTGSTLSEEHSRVCPLRHREAALFDKAQMGRLKEAITELQQALKSSTMYEHTATELASRGRQTR